MKMCLFPKFPNKSVLNLDSHPYPHSGATWCSGKCDAGVCFSTSYSNCEAEAKRITATVKSELDESSCQNCVHRFNCWVGNTEEVYSLISKENEGFLNVFQNF